MAVSAVLVGVSAFFGAGVAEVNAQVVTDVGGRFPHDKHLDKVRNCTGCHELDAKTWEQKGKVARNHQPCNTAVCHGEEWKKEPGDFCLTCHQKNLQVKYPPYRARGESDWVLAKFSHQGHIKDKGDKACASCHATLKVKAPPKGSDARPAADMGDATHKACAQCHAKGQAPEMSDCVGCHQERGGDKVEPSASASWDSYRVTYAFRHADHAKKSKSNECGTCHKNALTGAGQAVPLPAMIDCEGCHNGEVAFSALGNECRRCHQIPTSSQGAPIALPAYTGAYRHETHDKAGISLNCESCHGGTKDGRVGLPGKEQHKPCANPGCHAEEFRKENSRICANCHTHNLPWLSNPVKREFSDVSEFWVGFGHQEHQGRLRTGFECQTCHPVQSGLPPRAPDPEFLALGHKDCAQCHGEFAMPLMTNCGGCHKLDATSPPPKGSAGPQWRVAEKFAHETHQQDPRSKQKLPCQSCHGDVLTVKSGERTPRPSMEGCASSCHNGEVAFKATGFGCVRCHGPSVKEFSVPASLPASQPAKP